MGGALAWEAHKGIAPGGSPGMAKSLVVAMIVQTISIPMSTCTRYGNERATGWKVTGVALCFAGGVATAWTDASGASLDGVVGGESNGGDGDGVRGMGGNDNPSARSLLGDLAGLLLAMGYGAYTVLLQHVCPKDKDRMSMKLLFGYVGLLNMISLFPVVVWLVASS